MPKRLAVVVVVALAAVGLFAQQALAAGGNAHFIYATSSLNGANVDVTFKEAGLGVNISFVHITLSADVTVTEFCVNNGTANPSATNKRTSTSTVSQAFTVNVDNGTTGDVTLTLTAPAPSLSCPSGQTATIGSVTYTNITVTDTDNGVFIVATPSTQSTGCLLPPGTRLKSGVSCT